MVEAGGILTEYDKLIDRQIERAALLRPQALQKYLQTLQKFSPQRPDKFDRKEARAAILGQGAK